MALLPGWRRQSSASRNFTGLWIIVRNKTHKKPALLPGAAAILAFRGVETRY
jgi:hypothetical protein